MSALDLLDSYLVMASHEPNHLKWNEKELGWSPVLLLHLQRLKALTKAFATPLEFFVSGDGFLYARQQGWEVSINQQIGEYLEVNLPSETKLSSSIRDISWIAERLFKFLVMLQPVKAFNRDWLMANSIGARFSIGLTESVIDSLDQTKIEQIRRLLAAILDPQLREFTETELTERFEMPALKQIEEAMWDNL